MRVTAPYTEYHEYHGPSWHAALRDGISCAATVMGPGLFSGQTTTGTVPVTVAADHCHSPARGSVSESNGLKSETCGVNNHLHVFGLSITNLTCSTGSARMDARGGASAES